MPGAVWSAFLARLCPLPAPPPHPSERSSEKVLCKDWPTLEDHTSSAFPEQWLLGILFGYLPVPSGFL